MYLPVVKPEIGGSLQKEFNVDDNVFAKKSLKRLDKENPVVSNFIRQYSKKTNDRVGSIIMGVTVYRMLESQAESNWMSENI